MTKDNQTMEWCDKRYIPVVRAISSTNTWIKVVSTMCWVVFSVMLGIVYNIFWEIKWIATELNMNHARYQSEIAVLQSKVANLEKNND